MNDRARELIQACRVPERTAPRDRGLWNVRRLILPERPGFDDPPSGLQSGDHYYALTRWTDATIHLPWGEVVMEDTPRELSTHLPILMRARGRVLVTGLGLGCVVRGLLSKPEVRHIDVVEIEPAVLELVAGEFRSCSRVTIHEGDAERVDWPEGTRWDYAWHDLWSEHESLPLIHVRLFERYRELVPFQGAWGLPRWFRRKAPASYTLGANA